MKSDIGPSAICFLSRRCHGDTERCNGRNLLFQDIFKGLDHLGSRASEALERKKGVNTGLEKDRVHPGPASKSDLRRLKLMPLTRRCKKEDDQADCQRDKKKSKEDQSLETSHLTIF